MDIKLITLSNYTRPALKEDKSSGYVMNGKDNSFYQYIIDRNNGSATNSSINNSYASLMYGRGLGFTNKVNDVVVQNWAELKGILRPSDLKRIVQDAQIFGEFAFQIVKNRDGSLNSITHLPKQMVVPSIESDEGAIESYHYSRNWKKKREEKYNPQEFPAYSGVENRSTEIYVGKEYKPGNEYFGTPDYISGMQYAEMEEEISNMNISSIKNGLSAGYIINIPNGESYTDEEKSEFERQVKKKLTASSNASNFLISFNGQAIKRVIAPKQRFVLEALEDVLFTYGVNLDLIFLPLTQEEEVLDTNSTEEAVDDQEEEKLSLTSSNELTEANEDNNKLNK